MKFSEIVKQATALLQEKGQVSYRMLKREFALDEDALDDLKAELIEVDAVAVDREGKMLVWVGAAAVPGSPLEGARSRSSTPSPASPGSYTPPIWRSVSVPHKLLWKRVAPPRRSARPSPPSLPISRAPRHSLKALTRKKPARLLIPPSSS